MWLLFVRPQISPSNILLFHLAIIETLLCVIYLVLAVPLLTRDDESMAAHTICNLNAFLTTLLQPIALWTVCGLNCDRYYAISAPLHYNAIVNSKKVIHCLCGGRRGCENAPIEHVKSGDYRHGLDWLARK